METTKVEGAGAGKSIGLCMSGGGHRASIFSLGALLYLVDAGRKDDVKAISSVSGGSLTSGFFVAQPKSLHDMKRAEFENCAAKWASQIAGSPTWWSAVMAMWGAFLLGWVLLICAGWGWWPWLAGTIRPPWWETQLLYLAVLCVWARIVGSRPGGTFWGWWGTWLYLGVAGPVFLLSILIWWSPFSWWSRKVMQKGSIFVNFAGESFSTPAQKNVVPRAQAELKTDDIATRGHRSPVLSGRAILQVGPFMSESHRLPG